MGVRDGMLQDFDSPHGFYVRRFAFRHGNWQDPATEGARRCTLFTKHGHQCLEPREGRHEYHTSQGRVHFRRCSPHYD